MGKLGVLLAVTAVLITSLASAGSLTAYYGDDDGFGIGAFAGTIDPTVSNAGVGEAPGTDVRLIGLGFIAPPFAPTGGFSFSIGGGAILEAVLTMRAGSWESTNPVDGPALPNVLQLDGLTIDSSFLAGFVQAGENVEERSITLDSSFFSSLADGSVSLLGTHLSERSGTGSFQIDFLRLDIETVPEPGTIALFALGALGMAGAAYRRRKMMI